MSVVDDSFDNPLNLEEQASMPFAGGIMQYGFQCGMIWGAALAAGAEAYRLVGPGSQTETKAIITAQRLVESFRARNKSINCVDITNLNKSSSVMEMVMYFLIKGGTIGCFRMAGNYAPAAFDDINTTLSEEPMEVPSPPVSCTAVLAKKMGASELQMAMAAGLAGGIGLSGGACGALGAAIWIIGLNDSKDGTRKIDFKNPKAIEIIEKFMKCADFKFKCSEIVGRKFENIDDHAGYLRDGGCSKIIEVLANE
jgi:hypothetical protein